MQSPKEEGDATTLLKNLQPPPFSVRVANLNVVAPVAAWSLPLAVPITVPRSIQRRMMKGKESAAVPKELIRGVNLSVQPGELAAIIGGSGSGKTTLLNMIACRPTTLEITSGAITFAPASTGTTPPRTANADPSANPRFSKRLSMVKEKGHRKLVGYVRQDDHLLPYLTVRETLTFAAALRLPKTVDKATRTQIVESTMRELGLVSAADTIVGGPFRKGISGGEKRRLTIGCTLVTLPSILVLDEPTTGLDSFTAFALLQTLSQLARRGRAVILSIHQPRSDAFPLFDKVTLLSTGSVVYSGATSKLLSHFAELGFQPESKTNPLDFVVDVSSIDTREDKAEELTRERVGKLVLAWKEKELASGEAVWNDVEDPSIEKDDLERGIERVTSRSSQSARSAEPPQNRPGVLAQTLLLSTRGMRNTIRNYGQTVGFMLQFTLIGVALGLAFYFPPETPAGIQSMKTIVYQSTPACFYLSIIIYTFILCGELVVFDREREDSLYGTIPWVAASFLSYLPSNVIFPTLYSIIVYFMTGFSRDNLTVNVFSFIAQCILQQLSAFSYALLCCAINRSFAQASLLANGFSIVFILTSGYLIVSLPVWIAWARWLSPYFYGFHWIARLQFEGRIFACDGVTGVARNQCEGTAVLIGLRFPLSTPVYVYPLGLLGFVIVTIILATLLLSTYHPGGVKHAAAQASQKEVVTKEKRQSEMLLQRKGVNVRVDKLALTVSMRTATRAKVDKVILREVDAEFPSGEVSVIMGPSGAGKSSLLQVLSGRLRSGPTSRFTTTGSVLLNNQTIDDITSFVEYVEQEDDYHLPALTVRETLHYAARLRLRGKTTAECHARAEEVLRQLGLRPCADNLVGGELVKGISGGEKRRLSLAVQLISDPAVLLADEPLSGLDAFTAQNVMTTLKEIAMSGRTVVVSVHQPRSDVWDLFDNVLLLAKGGRTAYSGPRSEILKVFEEAGAVCAQDFNPADFILDTISVDQRSLESEEKSDQQVTRIVDAWKARAASDEKATSAGSTLEGEKEQPQPSTSDTPAPKGHRSRSSPFYISLPVVLGRSFRNLRRQPDTFVARLSNPPFMSLLFWIFFGRLSLNPSSAQDRVGLLQETTALPFVGMLACLAIFPSEKRLFLHEYASSGRQSVSTFIASYTVQETATSLISSLLFSIVFVYGMNLQQSARIFIEFWMSSFCLLSAGESIGIVFSSFFNNGGLAVSIVSAVITIFAQLNGIISVTLPEWLKVVGWASPMKPQCRIQIINEMSGLVFNCNDASIASGECLAATGEQLLDTFSIPPSDTAKYMGILFALIVIFRLLAVAALRLKVATL